MLRCPDVAMQPETIPDKLDIPEGTDEGTLDMFGRKKSDAEGAKLEIEVSQPEPREPEEDEAPASLSLRSRIRDRAPISPPVRPTVARPEPVRRPPDIHTATGRRLDRPGSDSEDKKLVVGREIALNGQINSCDKLIVEGRVEANMRDCREIEIADSGTFKGEADIETADISGTFEGSLTAQKLLIVRSSGRITGKVRFGQLEIERGGEIIGDIQVYSPVESREPSSIRTEEAPAE